MAKDDKARKQAREKVAERTGDLIERWQQEAQQERETQRRDWKIAPHSMYPNYFTLTYPIGQHVSTELYANADELIDLAKAIVQAGASGELGAAARERTITEFS